ncbi:MAG TPA: STAS domain-containing protein [Paucimonas sp.]|nr:STAS domain-containing protein [Paucimonas sp.]
MFRPTLTLTVNNATTALDAGLRAIESGQTAIDLAQLTAVDSAAVATLLEWKRAAHKRGQPLVFHNLPAGLASLAKLYGVAELLASPAPADERADLLHH